MTTTIYPYVIPDPNILIDDSIFNITTITDTQKRNASFSCMIYFGNGFIVITSHEVRAYQCSSISYTGTNTNYRMFDPAGANDRSFGHQSFLKCSTADLRGRQHAAACIDGTITVKQIEIRN